MLEKPAHKPLHFKLLSRDEFNAAWEKGALSSIFFGRAAAMNGIDLKVERNVVGYLTDMADMTHYLLKAKTRTRDRRRAFRKATGFSDEQIAQGIAITANPQEYAYNMMTGYNRDKHDWPEIHFAIGRGKTRYYVA